MLIRRELVGDNASPCLLVPSESLTLLPDDMLWQRVDSTQSMDVVSVDNGHVLDIQDSACAHLVSLRLSRRVVQLDFDRPADEEWAQYVNFHKLILIMEDRPVARHRMLVALQCIQRKNWRTGEWSIYSV